MTNAQKREEGNGSTFICAFHVIYKVLLHQFQVYCNRLRMHIVIPKVPIKEIKQ